MSGFSQRNGEGTEEYERLNGPAKKLKLSHVKQISSCQHAKYDGPSLPESYGRDSASFYS